MAQPLATSVQPTDIYGGDEVSALVLDPGYCSTRAGYAGEDVPKSVIPSFYGSVGPSSLSIGDDALGPREGMEIRNYMSRDSIVEEWDLAVNIWQIMLVNSLLPTDRMRPAKIELNDAQRDEEGDVSMEDVDAMEKPLEESPLLMSEAPWSATKSREKAIETIMENWGCPAFWLSRTPVLAAFAAGKASALVIDVGGANTSVTCIHDGMVLKRSIQRSPVGGLWLSSQIRSLWSNSKPKVEIVPRYLVESKVAVDAGAPPLARLRQMNYPISDSVRAYHEERVLTEFKESVVEVWHQGGKFMTPGNEDYAHSQPGPVFEMPDGSNQMWREQRFRVAEGMWDHNAQLAPNGSEGVITASQTIPEMVKSALGAVDLELRPNLLANVVVTGSSSLVRGFNDRLNNELVAMFPSTRIKLHAAGLTTERRFGAWIGGSILASLGTFHQMWISRKEYEEHGPGIVEKRCK